jgi:hypothetical protein
MKKTFSLLHLPLRAPLIFFPDVQTYNIYEDFIYFRNSNQQIEVNYIFV